MPDRGDPTGTRNIIRSYESALVGRFRRLRAAIRRSIVDQDAFGLYAPGTRKPVLGAFVSDFRISDDNPFHAGDQIDPTGRRAFAGFTRADQKATAFLDWLRQQSDAGILEVLPGTPIGASAQAGWQNTYIDSAYRKGMRDASELVDGLPRSPAAVQASFLGPVHAERAGLIYSRNLEALRGITVAQSEAIREVLATGLIDGANPRTIARQIANRVDKIGITRARTLARTEVIATHAEATLTSFEAAGVHNVSNQAEFRTAGDDRVCPLCEAPGRQCLLDS